MFESFFANPAYVAAGASLVSLPIIIHLINRMRFKRIRWAAMEFLLKSQKKNRRRLIIEQLILLALRCLLVLLAVLLVSRYRGFSFTFMEPQTTDHFVIIDDSLSMTDQHRDEGETRDCFRFAKDIITREIARNAVQARTAQRLILAALSDPSRRQFDERLSEQSIPELQKILADLECTFGRLKLSEGVDAAREFFDKVPQDQRLLHIVADFRQRDWGEAEAADLTTKLEALGRSGVKINLIDAAHPHRNENQARPLHHDNLSIVDLQPEVRVAARDMPVQFTVTVANHGASERKDVRVAFKVNGMERLEASVNITIAAGGMKSEKTQIIFDQVGFNQITANIESEESGVQADNVRYTLLDVRPRVPVLIIDGDPSNGLKPGGDSYHVQALLTSARGYVANVRAVNELEQSNLDQYASIYLLNVGNLTEKAIKNLEDYVRDGGAVAFFLGDRVRGDFYTEKLFRKGKGIFPAPLRDRPQPPLTEEEMQPDLFDQQLKLFVRNDKHPIFAEVWDPRYRPFFSFLPIRRYYPVIRSDWQQTPGQIEELATLPNQRSMRDYTDQAQEIIAGLSQTVGDPKFDKFKNVLDRYRRQIRDLSVSDRPLYELARMLDDLLQHKGKPGDAQDVSLAGFWSEPDSQKLRGRIERFRDTVQLGDPLVITQMFGKGRVVAFMTTAGQSWNNWSGGSPASATFPPVMVELQKFLTGGSTDTNRSVGQPLLLSIDGGRYENRMRTYYQAESRDPQAAPGGAAAAADGGMIDKGEVTGLEAAGRINFEFTAGRKPGLYRFELTPRKEGAGQSKTETRAFVYNVDPAEGELARAPRDDLERSAPNVAKLRNPGTNWGVELANRQSDLSESAWFYLVFLIILVAEQALAVHLSFHLKSSELPVRGHAGRSQPAAA